MLKTISVSCIFCHCEKVLFERKPAVVELYIISTIRQRRLYESYYSSRLKGFPSQVNLTRKNSRLDLNYKRARNNQNGVHHQKSRNFQNFQIDFSAHSTIVNGILNAQEHSRNILEASRMRPGEFRENTKFHENVDFLVS